MAASILIIDDDMQIRQMLRQMLEQEGYEVQDASNGQEALKYFRKKPADVVITDIIMPDKEGLETIRDLKQYEPDLKIIAMSGGGRVGPETYLKMARSFGADHTFTKPIERENLLTAIQKLLGVSEK